jgi:S1-C subfamily serine protease
MTDEERRPEPKAEGGARRAADDAAGYREVPAFSSAPGPSPWPLPPDPRGAPRRRALGLLAVLAAAALVLGTMTGLVVRTGSTGSGNRFGTAIDDTRPDGTLTDEPGTPGPADAAVRRIADAVSPAIVNVLVQLANDTQSAGSGLVLTSSGHVLTNNHVINGATDITVEIGITGDRFDAEVLGYDVGDDVALLELEDASGLETINTAPSSTLTRNQRVVAIGNALGRFGAPTAVPGRITALHQDITAGDGPERERLIDMIRFSGSIHPGDSGGALVDTEGRVVGMNTAADPGGSRLGFSIEPTGFAIPIETAIAIAEQIRQGDDRNGVHIGDRALLGVVLSESSEATPFGDGARNGALVTDVGDDTPASDAGLEEGSIIVGVGRRTIRSNDDLRAALDAFHPGDRVVVHWIDADGDAHRATVTLVEGPPA